MATIHHFGPFIVNSGFNMSPGELSGWGMGPVPSGVVSVSAHGLPRLVTGPQSLTVVKLTMRTTSNPNECFIDFTVRNDSSAPCRYMRVVCTSITP